MEPRNDFLRALADLQRGLGELGAPAMIIGGLAVIAHGVPRLTVDIDATVAAAALSVERLAEVLARHGIEARIEDAVAFARQRQIFLGVHGSSGTPIDVSLAWLPFELEALRGSREHDFAGVRIRIPRPEDLVIYKMVAARPRDLDDVEGLLAIHGGTMDLDRVRTTVGEFAGLLEAPDRVELLEALIRRTEC